MKELAKFSFYINAGVDLDTAGDKIIPEASRGLHVCERALHHHVALVRAVLALLVDGDHGPGPVPDVLHGGSLRTHDPTDSLSVYLSSLVVHVTMVPHA